MEKICHLKTRIFFIVAVAQMVRAGSVAGTNFDNSLLSGKELKVVMTQVPPATLIYLNDATGEVIGYGGFYYEQLLWLSLRLDFSLYFEVPKDRAPGSLVNGTWNGLRGQLQRNDVDLVCFPFTGFVGYDIMELAIYLMGDSCGLFTRYPMPQTATDGPIKIFSLNVWIGLLISMISMVVCIQFWNFFRQKYFSEHSMRMTPVSSTCLYIWATLTNHSGYYRNGNFSSFKILATAWCLATFVFVYIYSSCMASYMSLTYQRPDVNTFKDLATNPNYQPIIYKGITAEYIILEGKSGITKEIGNKFRKCTTGCSITNFDEIFGNVLEKNFVAIIPLTVGNYYIKNTISKRQCRLTMGQDTMAFLNMFMGVPKTSPFVKELNQQSFWWHSLGFQSYWMKKLNPIARQCLLNYNNQGESVKPVERARLKLEQLYVPFIILFIGYILGLIQFTRERFITVTV